MGSCAARRAVGLHAATPAIERPIVLEHDAAVEGAPRHGPGRDAGAVVTGVVHGGALQAADPAQRIETVETSVVAGPEGPAVPQSARADERALREVSAEHLERSKLVVLGLATRDPQDTKSDDWQYERQLAGTLLSDTRLYRLAAQDRGISDVAR